MSKPDDYSVQETALTKVEATAHGWSIQREDGWSCGVPKVLGGEEPREGDRARFYGRNTTEHHGLDVWRDGEWCEVYYTTPEQREHDRQRWLAWHARDKRRRFEEAKAGLDRDYAALPDAFQRRIARFRRNNPDFRVEWEGYEMMACRDAVKIAAWLREQADPVDADALQGAVGRMCDMRHEEWKAAVPDLEEGHSGNTFGMAKRLGALYAGPSPWQVEWEHGAGAVLVGCEDYGCPPPTDEERAEIEAAHPGAFEAAGPHTG